MEKKFELSNLGLELREDEPIVSSRIVAEKLGKRHDQVLRDLENIMNRVENTGEISTTQMCGLFIESNYVASNGKTNKQYLLTKKGFLLYVFNIQGYDMFKLQYINEFERLQKIVEEKNSQEWLNSRKNGKITRRKETDMIQKLIKYSIDNFNCQNTKFFYSNYTRLINKPLNLGTGQREFIDYQTLIKINQAEDIIQNEIKIGIENGLHYAVIYEKCKEKIKVFYDLVGTNVRFLGINENEEEID